MRSVLAIFDTRATCYYSPNKGDFVELEENKPPRNIKSIAKGLDSYGFVIVEYSVRSDSRNMIVIRDQAYYFPIHLWSHVRWEKVPSGKLAPSLHSQDPSNLQ